MYIDDLIEKLQAQRDRHGNVKVYIYTDECDTMLRVDAVTYDVFCPECGTIYCELTAESAPESYWNDHPCCS